MGTALDVAIGLSFLYLLLALLVTTLQELGASLLRLRAKQLFQAIEGMLKEGTSSPIIQKLYAHPLIANLAEKDLELVKGKLPMFGAGLPSYIPSKNFAIALLDVLQGQPVSDASGIEKGLASARAAVAKIQVAKLRDALNVLLDETERVEKNVDKQFAEFSLQVESWFNDRMVRASGWYKRQAQAISLCLGVFVSAACNASSFKVAERLWHDASLRAAVVSSARGYREASAGLLVSSDLPIGWHGNSASGWDLLFIPVGWVVTGLAVSLGSTFWFDLLGKALQLRGTGPKVSAKSGEVEEKNR